MAQFSAIIALEKPAKRIRRKDKVAGAEAPST